MQISPAVSWVTPLAAFYVLVDVSSCLGMQTPSGKTVDDAVGLCVFLLESARVALVPGEAFGCPGTLRIAFATSMSLLEVAMSRVKEALGTLTIR